MLRISKLTELGTIRGRIHLKLLLAFVHIYIRECYLRLQQLFGIADTGTVLSGIERITGIDPPVRLFPNRDSHSRTAVIKNKPIILGNRLHICKHSIF